MLSSTKDPRQIFAKDGHKADQGNRWMELCKDATQ